MALLDKIREFAKTIPAEVKESKDTYTLEFVLAERKAFLTKQKLTYTAKFKIDESSKELRFT